MRLEDQISNLIEQAGEFRRDNPLPYAWYNREGDALEVYLEEGEGVAESVDPLVTVVVSKQNRTQVIGFVLKRLKQHFIDSLRQVKFQAGSARIRFLLYDTARLREISFMRDPSCPQGDRAPKMTTDDMIRLYGDVEIANPDELCV